MPSRTITTQEEINAPPDKVWAAFGNFAEMPKWQSWLSIKKPGNITDAGVSTQLAVGLTPQGQSTFNLTPQVMVNEPGKQFKWKGRMISDWVFTGEHSFQFEELPGKRTRITHSENFSGLLVPLLGGVISTAEQEFGKFNKALKAHVESSK